MTDPQSEQRASKPHRSSQLTGLALKLAVTVLVFLAVLWNVELGAIRAAFRSIDHGWLIVGLGLLLLHFLLMVWRWDFVLRSLYGQKIGFGRLCYIYSLGETIGTFLPSFIGMDAIRTVALATTAPLRVVLQSVFVDRVLGIVSLLLLIAFTLPLAIVSYGPGTVFWSLLAISAGGLAAYAAVLSGGAMLGWVPWIGGIASVGVEQLRAATVRKDVAPIVLASGVVMQILSVAIFWSAARMLGAQVGLADCMTIVPAAFLAASLPISLSGWGVREGAMAFGFHLLGVDSAPIVAASICYGLSGLVSGAMGMAASFLLPAPRSGLDVGK
jgi:hypothetical protein